jgi:hypothetical protein
MVVLLARGRHAEGWRSAPRGHQLAPGRHEGRTPGEHRGGCGRGGRGRVDGREARLVLRPQQTEVLGGLGGGSRLPAQQRRRWMVALEVERLRFDVARVVHVDGRRRRVVHVGGGDCWARGRRGAVGVAHVTHGAENETEEHLSLSLSPSSLRRQHSNRSFAPRAARNRISSQTAAEFFAPWAATIDFANNRWQREGRAPASSGRPLNPDECSRRGWPRSSPARVANLSRKGGGSSAPAPPLAGGRAGGGARAAPIPPRGEWRQKLIFCSCSSQSVCSNSARDVWRVYQINHCTCVHRNYVYPLLPRAGKCTVIVVGRVIVHSFAPVVKFAAIFS